MGFDSVDDYLASKPADVQEVLRRVRAILRKALPAADEVISYQIPTYKLQGERVVYFAGWKEHWSLYPASAGLVAALGKELTPYEMSKGTIRFPLADGVPVRLVQRIAKHLLGEAQARLDARAARRRKPAAKKPTAAGKKRGVVAKRR